MKLKLKKSYSFALRTALYITVLIAVIAAIFIFFLGIFFDWGFFALVLCCFFIIGFFVIQYRIEHFIYRRIKKIYNDLKLLESSNFSKKGISTNMLTLTKEIEKYAQHKKIEIETLKIREVYRREFLGNVSHELKTPLFTVQGYIETLSLGAINDKNVRDKYLKQAGKGVERLIYIVKDLDMISKLESGEMSLNIQPFDIIELIKNVFDLLDMRAEKKRITLILENPDNHSVMVMADRDRIQQVLTNLIDNTIKYGHKKGTTEVYVENLIKNKVIVRVIDNGEGFEKKNIPRLFERFFRVDQSRSRKEGGSGLGLAIVKHIVEAHEEKIYVESDPGVGSEFSFTLEKAE